MASPPSAPVKRLLAAGFKVEGAVPKTPSGVTLADVTSGTASQTAAPSGVTPAGVVARGSVSSGIAALSGVTPAGKADPKAKSSGKGEGKR